MRLAVCAALVCAMANLTAGALAAPGARTQAESVARATVTHYSAQAGSPSPLDCVAPAGDPDPGTQEWTQRDLVNQYCATERLQDQYANPAFAATFWTQTPGIYANQNLEMLSDPAHPHLTLGQLVPGGSTTDPYRTLDRWTAAKRGRVTKVTFPADDGATLNGYLFRPPAKVKRPYPGVVITTGSIQGYQQMYFWAAEGLAEAGYMVLTYDVQGQGNSDTLPGECAPDSCPGVPYQQDYNFFQGTEDALNWFFSAKNPARSELDAARVGIAGHSLGASAVSVVGQCDPRVRAVVAWDNLAPATGACREQVPAGLPAGAPVNPTLRTPALGINSEYFFNPTPANSPPDPQSRAGAFAHLAGAGTDTMQIGLRSSTHLEYTYVPYILPASRLGERVAFYYTLAWFDRYVRGNRSGFTRLVAETFDRSADAHSIGAGTYTPPVGNTPYAIAGLPVEDRVSIYYASEYALTSPKGAKVSCGDMRAGC